MGWGVTMQQNKPVVIGLTGGIGSGKTTVSQEFEALGIIVVDADVIAREVVAPGEPLLAELADRFGAHVLMPDGTLNRAVLREIIFSDVAKKEQLNALIHPVIRHRLITQLSQAKSAYVILSAPLLFENNLDSFCQRNLVVDIPVEVQIERTIGRDGVSKEQVNAILNAQWPRQRRLTKADDIIDNSLPLDSLPERVRTLHKKYLALTS